MKLTRCVTFDRHISFACLFRDVALACQDRQAAQMTYSCLTLYVDAGLALVEPDDSG